MCICLIISNYFPSRRSLQCYIQGGNEFFFYFEITDHKVHTLHNSPPNVVRSFRKKSNFITKPSNTKKSVSLEIE